MVRLTDVDTPCPPFISPQAEVYAELNKETITLAARGDADAIARLRAGGNSADSRQYVANLLLHCADVSNPTKPKRLQDRWAECVTAEFWEQGDREVALGLPVSPGFDRRTTSLAMSQARGGCLRAASSSSVR